MMQKMHGIPSMEKVMSDAVMEVDCAESIGRIGAKAVRP
jgi:hypothetical protein